MQNPVQKFRQSFTVFEKPRPLSEKWKKFDKLQLQETLVNYVEILHTFSNYQCL